MLLSQVSAYFANFRQKIGVILKNNAMNIFFQKLEVVWAKNANFFRPIFRQKYF
jgi:hypothetical protein